MTFTRHMNYLRLPYKHQGLDENGVDCFGLLRLFYRNELGVELPLAGFDYEEQWWIQHNYIFDLHQKYNFRQISEPPRLGDVLLFKNTSTHPGHIGIVLDSDYFIHMLKSGCNVATYSYGLWQRQIFGVFRYMGEADEASV